MGKVGKFFLGLSIGGGAAAAAIRWGPVLVRNWLGIVCTRVNFAGQRPGAVVVGGENGRAAIFCSTDYDPDWHKKAGRKLGAAAAAMLLLAVLFRTRKK